NESSDPKRPYGDLIIWKSILHKAKEDGVSIVFTTSDSKEDWWALDESKNILHPRDELISEFKDFVENKTQLMMLPMKEFTEYFSRLKQTSFLYAHIELNALNIIKDQINYSTEITPSLIHDGELQLFMENGLLEDVEDFEINDVTLFDNNIDFDEDKASITGTLTMQASAIITEAFGSEYSESSAYDLEISAEFSIELDLNIEYQDYEVTNFKLYSIKVHNAAPQEDILYDEQCVICERKSGVFNLFPNSPICSECSSNGDYFICTNCSTVYKNEDYGGDGQYCQNCIGN
ncbi:PIN-like domain-containing protein, partial [Bacillus sp. LR_6]|uniref:PIN-like domain-containing protein n=1 Tax=Bacillus sp. LR_6 TaxID=3055785 RepID=UPI0035BF7C7B